MSHGSQEDSSVSRWRRRWRNRKRARSVRPRRPSPGGIHGLATSATFARRGATSFASLSWFSSRGGTSGFIEVVQRLIPGEEKRPAIDETRPGASRRQARPANEVECMAQSDLPAPSGGQFQVLSWNDVGAAWPFICTCLSGTRLGIRSNKRKRRGTSGSTRKEHLA